MADENSIIGLLFDLKADPSGVLSGTQAAQAAVAALRNQLNVDVNHMANVSATALGTLGNQLNSFLTQRLPVVGSLFSSLSAGILNFGVQSAKGAADLQALQNSISGIAIESGKSEREVVNFFASISTISQVALRAEAANRFFGDTLARELGPKLRLTEEQLKRLATETDALKNSTNGVISQQGMMVFGLVALAAAAATATGALFHLTKQVAEYGEEIYQSHLKTRLSIETTSALKEAAQEAGESLGGLTIGFLQFSRSLDRAAEGNERMTRALRARGVSTFTDTDKALTEFIDHLRTLQTEEERTAAISEVFGGRFGARLIGVFNQVIEGGGGLEQFKAALRETGQMLSNEQVISAHKATVAMRQLESAYEAIGRQVGASLLPALASVTKFLADNLSVLLLVTAAFVTLGTVMVTLAFPSTALAIKNLVSGLGALVAVLAGTATAAQAAQISLATLTATAGALALLFAALVVAVGYYIKSSQELEATTQEEIDALQKQGKSIDDLEIKLGELTNAQQGSEEWHSKLNEILKQLTVSTRLYIEAAASEEEQAKRTAEAIRDLRVENEADARMQAIITLDKLKEQYETEETLRRNIQKVREEFEARERGQKQEPGIPYEMIQGASDWVAKKLQGLTGVENYAAFSTKGLKEVYAEFGNQLTELSPKITTNEIKLRALTTAAGMTYEEYKKLVGESPKLLDVIRGMSRALLTGTPPRNYLADFNKEYQRLNDAYVKSTPIMAGHAASVAEQTILWNQYAEAVQRGADSRELLTIAQKAGVTIGEQEQDEIIQNQNRERIGLEITLRKTAALRAEADARVKAGGSAAQRTRDELTYLTMESKARELAMRRDLEIAKEKMRGLADIQKQGQQPESKQYQQLEKQIRDLSLGIQKEQNDLKIQSQKLLQDAANQEKQIRVKSKNDAIQIEKEKAEGVKAIIGSQVFTGPKLEWGTPTPSADTQRDLREGVQRVIKNYGVMIQEEARKAKLSDAFMVAMAATESGGSARATSHDKFGKEVARGLFQFTEATWKKFGEGSWKEAYDAAKSTRAAMKYFAYELEQAGGDYRQALASYNSTLKHFTSEKALSQLPKDVFDHLKKVSFAYKNIPKDAQDAQRLLAQVDLEVMQSQLQVMDFELQTTQLTEERRAELLKQRAILVEQIANKELDIVLKAEKAKIEAAQRAEQAAIQRSRTELQIASIRDERMIAQIQAESALEVRSAEDTAKAIFDIRLAAHDREVKELSREREALAGTVVDPEEYRRRYQEITDQLSIYAERRMSLIEEANREFERQRQIDLDRERAYADELRRATYKIVDTYQQMEEELLQIVIRGSEDRQRVRGHGGDEFIPVPDIGLSDIEIARLEAESKAFKAQQDHLQRQEDLLSKEQALRDKQIKEEKAANDARERLATEYVELLKAHDAEVARVTQQTAGKIQSQLAEENQRYDRLISSLEARRSTLERQEGKLSPSVYTQQQEKLNQQFENAEREHTAALKRIYSERDEALKSALEPFLKEQQRINDALDKLEEDSLKSAQERKEERARLNAERTANDRQYQVAKLSIDTELRRAEIAIEREELRSEIIREGFSDERKERALNLLLEEEELNYKSIQATRDLWRDKLLAEVKGMDEYWEVIDQWMKRREEEDKKHEKRREKILAGGKEGAVGSLGDLSSRRGRRDGGFGSMADQLREREEERRRDYYDKTGKEDTDFQWKTETQIALLDTLDQAWAGVANAVSSAVEAYVLYGKAGASVQQVTAQILASLAAQAAGKAAFELAEGFADLADAIFGFGLNPNAMAAAMAHFKSAAIYGAIAGVAAIAGRGVAGTSFQQGAAGEGATGSQGTGTSGEAGIGGTSGTPQSRSKEDKPIKINLGRNIVVEHVITIQAQPGFIANETIKALDRNNPQLRDRLVRATGRR